MSRGFRCRTFAVHPRFRPVLRRRGLGLVLVAQLGLVNSAIFLKAWEAWDLAFMCWAYTQWGLDLPSGLGRLQLKHLVQAAKVTLFPAEPGAEEVLHQVPGQGGADHA